MTSQQQVIYSDGMPVGWPYYHMPFELKARMEVILFEADPAVTASLVPEPLTAHAAGACALTSLTAESEHWGPFNETFISLACDLHGTPGFYCLLVCLTDPRALCAGRETLGVPKVLCEISGSANLSAWGAGDVTWSTTYDGQEIIRSRTGDYEAISVDELPSLLLPLWCLKVIPNPAGGAGPDAIRQLVELTDEDEVISDAARTTHVEEVTLSRAVPRTGTVGGIDLTPLRPIAFGDAYRFSLSCLDGLGKVVHEYGHASS